jgi:hypothetical protein
MRLNMRKLEHAAGKTTTGVDAQDLLTNELLS